MNKHKHLIILVLLFITSLFTLCSCGVNPDNCVHDWGSPTCLEPAQCWKCDAYKPDGKLGNHNYDAATCREPAKCNYCYQYKDDNLGSHYFASDGYCKYCGISRDSSNNTNNTNNTSNSNDENDSNNNCKNGHKGSESSEWNVDYDNATNVLEYRCTICEEMIEIQSMPISTFINGNHFTIYPAAFANRFEDSSSKLNNIDYYAKSEPSYGSYIFDEDNLIYYRIQDKNDDYNDIGMMSFSDANHKTLSVIDDYSENNIVYINILIEDSWDVSAVVYSAILAIDPNISYSKAAEVGQIIVDNIAINIGEIDEKDFKGTNYNDINYLLYKDNKYHYLIISPTSSI